MGIHETHEHETKKKSTNRAEDTAEKSANRTAQSTERTAQSTNRTAHAERMNRRNGDVEDDRTATDGKVC